MRYEHDVEITVRDAIRRERNHRGWTQTRLGQEMTKRGIPTNWPAINKIEAGTRNVTITEAAIIADAFGITVNRLIGGHSRPRADHDFALRRLHESVADAQRSTRTAVRDLTATLAQLAELKNPATQNLITDIETSIHQLDTAATHLAQAGGKIAEARGRNNVWHAQEPSQQQPSPQ